MTTFRNLQQSRVRKLMDEPRAAQRAVARRLFGPLERIGFHVVADHFYEPIPNVGATAAAAANQDPAAPPRASAGIDYRADEAAEALRAAMQDFGRGWDDAVAARRFDPEEQSFRGLDALALYLTVRRLSPARIVEIGQGASTKIAHAALEDCATEDSRPSLTTVDPYTRLAGTASNEHVDVDLRSNSLQDEWNDLRSLLAPGDLLFVDSSHTYKPGSDVQFLFDVVLPELPVGVTVHIHDVFSPYDYPLSWMTEHRRFWNEAYILENFLRFNDSFETTLPVHLLARTRPDLEADWSATHPRPLTWDGGSFYLRRTR